MSTSSFQSGLPSTFAYRSQTALTMAAVARWMTPFSGPDPAELTVADQVSVERPEVGRRVSSSVRPTTRGARASIAATQSSLPRPVVKVIP